MPLEQATSTVGSKNTASDNQGDAPIRTFCGGRPVSPFATLARVLCMREWRNWQTRWI